MSSRTKAILSVRPKPTLDESCIGRVLVVEYDGIRIKHQTLVSLDRKRLSGAIEEALDRKQDFALFCPCVTSGMPRMYQRIVKGECLICCSPGTKATHVPQCTHHGMSSMKARPPWVAREYRTVDWMQAMNNPNRRTKRRRAKSAPRAQRPKSGNAVKTSYRPTEVSQLLHLVEASRSNVHVPGSVHSTSGLLQRFAEVLEPVTANGQVAEQRTLVLGGYADTAVAQSSETVLTSPNDLDFAVVIAEVMSVDKIPRGRRRLHFRDTDLTIEVTTDQWRYAQQHTDFPNLHRARLEFGQADSPFRLLALMHVTRNPDGQLVAKRCRLLVTNAQGIPVASRAEAKIADHLVAAGRHFEKPLFLTKGYPYLHDFVLLDCGLPFYIEVNGRSDDEYRTAKELVLSYLEEFAPGRYLAWWVEAEPLPAYRIPRADTDSGDQPDR